MKRDNKRIKKNLRRLGNYLSNFVLYLLPNCMLRWWTRRKMSALTPEQKAELNRRMDYYVRLPQDCQLGKDAVRVSEFTFPWRKKHKMTQYFFDLYRSVRLYPGEWRFNYLFGDVAHEPPVPTLVKSRPVKDGGRTMSVLCQLNRLRHFHFVEDKTPFREKKDMLVFRNVTDGMPWRQDFLYKYAGHPLCDVGHTNHVVGIDEELRKPFLSIDQQLQYKFIACIEGNDVATNLKWVMSSNSVAVMPRPTRETWFMEGTLIPNYHYIEIQADYSDLPEKVQYYAAHPDEAEAIVRHAHEYVAHFRDQQFEALIQHEVVREYFLQTNKV